MGPYLAPLLLVLYYLLVWLLRVHNTAHANLVVRYQPPDDLSAAATRYIYVMGVDGRSLAAALAEFEARNLISITPSKEGYQLHQLTSRYGVPPGLTEDQKILFRNLFEWEPTVVFHRPDRRLMEKLEKSLQQQFGRKYLTSNFIFVIIGLVLTALATAWLGISLDMFGRDLSAWMMSLYAGTAVAAAGIFGIQMFNSILTAMKLAVRGLYHRRILPLLLSMVLIYPVVWYFIIRNTVPLYANVTGMLIMINVLATPALKSYTKAGQKLRDEILGFRQFLQSVHQDPLDRLNPAKETVHTGHEYMPYAIALDLREGWGDRLGNQAIEETRL